MREVHMCASEFPEPPSIERRARMAQGNAKKLLQHRNDARGLPGLYIPADENGTQIVAAMMGLKLIAGFHDWPVIVDDLMRLAPWLAYSTASALLKKAWDDVQKKGAAKYIKDVGIEMRLLKWERKEYRIRGWKAVDGSGAHAEDEAANDREKDRMRKQHSRIAKGATPREHSRERLKAWDALKRGGFKIGRTKYKELPAPLMDDIEAPLKQAADGMMSRADAEMAAQRLYVDYLAARPSSSAAPFNKEGTADETGRTETGRAPARSHTAGPSPILPIDASEMTGGEACTPMQPTARRPRASELGRELIALLRTKPSSARERLNLSADLTAFCAKSHAEMARQRAQHPEAVAKLGRELMRMIRPPAR
jgi:hypothetical protein